jgi:hypothetical protein
VRDKAGTPRRSKDCADRAKTNNEIFGQINSAVLRDLFARPVCVVFDIHADDA